MEKYSNTVQQTVKSPENTKVIPKFCKHCPCREQGTKFENCQTTVTRHIWKKYIDTVDDYRYTPWVKDLYNECKQKIERVFADAKVKHSLRYTQLSGLAKVTMQVMLTFAYMNLKKSAKWKGCASFPTSFFASFSNYSFPPDQKHSRLGFYRDVSAFGLQFGGASRRKAGSPWLSIQKF